MSRTASLLNQSRQDATTSNTQPEHQISLVDRTRPADDDPDHRTNGEGEGETERNGSEATDVPPTPSTAPELFKKLTNNSLSIQQSVRQQITKQKYSRYGQDRYDVQDPTQPPAPDEGPSHTPQPGEVASPQQTSYLERGRAKAKGLLKRKRTVGKSWLDDTIIDVLYENQRGFFFAGIPHYSAASLLPSDPRPWQNAQFRTSPVDIRNAQVPDPSWEWAWKGWYADMSRDVDEEGWEYSLFFKAGSSWHGNHPWFHSFVRRRRWLRMRKRRDVAKHITSEKGHALGAEYFTIHPNMLRSAGDGEDSDRAGSTNLSRIRVQKEQESAVEEMEITDVAALMRALRKSSVDREKLVAVRNFVSSTGDELYYLSDRMPEIMSLLIYQSSRRQLLAELIKHHDSAHTRRESLKDHQHSADDDKQREHDSAVRQAENLHRAVEAAEAQVKRLEYWSDIKGMATDDLTSTSSPILATTMAGKEGHPQQSFASLQPANEGAHELHSHPEHPHGSNGEENTGPGGESLVKSPPSKRASSVWFDSQTSPRTESSRDSEADLDRYTTANESVHSDEQLGGSVPKSLGGGGRSWERERGKGKGVGGRVSGSGLDGVDEEAAGVGGEDYDGLAVVAPLSEDGGDVVERDNA